MLELRKSFFEYKNRFVRVERSEPTSERSRNVYRLAYLSFDCELRELRSVLHSGREISATALWE